MATHATTTDSAGAGSPNAQIPPPGSRVAGITELLENILIHLPAKDLILAKRTSRQFDDVIKTSSGLRPNFEAQIPKNVTIVPISTTIDLLPIHPKLFESCSLLFQDFDLKGDFPWQIYIIMDFGELGAYVAGGNEPWRKMLICKDTTQEIHATMAVEDARNPGGPWDGRDSDDEGDGQVSLEERWEESVDGSESEEESGMDQIGEGSEGEGSDEENEDESDYDDPDGYEIGRVFTSEVGITLGDLADWAYELRDMPQEHPQGRFYSILFTILVNAEGHPKRWNP